MKVAIVGSRTLTVNNLENYLPGDTTELVSGGAIGIDTCAREYARKNGLKITEFFPNYNQYGRKAPIIRNDLIINYADIVVAFWDGKSNGTKYVIQKCKELNKKINIYISNKK